MARLFAAILLDDATRRFALDAIGALERADVDARFERPEKLHLTLAFLGSVADARVPEYAAALAAAAGSRFALQLDRLGGFPDERRPKLLWLGCSKPQPGYVDCAVRTRQAFGALGAHEFEKDLQPHVTLCRAKRPLRGLPRIDVGSVVLPVRELALVASLPDGPTTRYEVQAIAPLESR